MTTRTQEQIDEANVLQVELQKAIQVAMMKFEEDNGDAIQSSGMSVHEVMFALGSSTMSFLYENLPVDNEALFTECFTSLSEGFVDKLGWLRENFPKE